MQIFVAAIHRRFLEASTFLRREKLAQAHVAAAGARCHSHLLAKGVLWDANGQFGRLHPSRPCSSHAPLRFRIQNLLQTLLLDQVFGELHHSQGRPRKIRLYLGESEPVLVALDRMTRHHSAFLARPVCALRPREAIVYRRWGLPRPEAAAVAPSRCCPAASLPMQG